MISGTRTYVTILETVRKSCSPDAAYETYGVPLFRISDGPLCNAFLCDSVSKFVTSVYSFKIVFLISVVSIWSINVCRPVDHVASWPPASHSMSSVFEQITILYPKLYLTRKLLISSLYKILCTLSGFVRNLRLLATLFIYQNCNLDSESFCFTLFSLKRLFNTAVRWFNCSVIA